MKNKKEIFYELTREESGKWVVDDIYLKQKKKGIEAYKSVTEQMDLLLTVALNSRTRGPTATESRFCLSRLRRYEQFSQNCLHRSWLK